MSISFNFGSGTRSEASTKPFYAWLWSSAFRTISDTGTLAKMTDIAAPLDKKTTVKVTLDKIANVYQTLAGGSVPVASQSANTSGATVFAEINTIATKTVGTTEIQLPMVGRVEVRLPFDADITESDVTTLVMAAFAALCNEEGYPVVVTEKMRGALTPVGI